MIRYWARIAAQTALNALAEATWLMASVLKAQSR